MTALPNRIQIASRIAVDTVGKLCEAIGTIPMPDAEDYDFEETMVVERLEETLSDGFIATRIRIRLRNHSGDPVPA
jgi:hypothetical protein